MKTHADALKSNMYFVFSPYGGSWRLTHTHSNKREREQSDVMMEKIYSARSFS